MKNLLITFLIILPLSLLGQNKIVGRVVDGDGKPIDAVSVVQKSMNSSFISGVYTNRKGEFILLNNKIPCKLYIEHICFKKYVIEVKNLNVGTIVLKEASTVLKGFVVKAERPIVKVIKGNLVYDLKQIANKGIANNTLEALKQLPNVDEQNGSFKIAGFINAKIILNGRLSSMSPSQLNTLLENTPVERIKKVEVMYSAPPKYHIRGAAINVVIKREKTYSFQGMAGLNYNNQFFDSYGANTNIRLSSPKTTLDILLSANKSRGISELELKSNHFFKGKYHLIEQESASRFKGNEYNLRIGTIHELSKTSQLDLSYTTNINPSTDVEAISNGTFSDTKTDKENDDMVHNISAMFSNDNGFSMGLDYTYYKSNNSQIMNNILKDNSLSSLDVSSSQKINRFNFNADYSHSVGKGWKMSYGGSAKIIDNSQNQIYNDVTGNLDTRNTDSSINEQTYECYIGTSKKFSPGTSLSFSATGEYYNQEGLERWSVYPRISFSYMKSISHIFQFNVLANKYYPSFWTLQNSISYMDAYTELHGTPSLRPSKIYQASGTYIYKRKYSASLFFIYKDDSFQQLAYQSPNKLALIYQMVNWDYNNIFGLNISIPFSIGKMYNAKLSLIGMNIHAKNSNFYDISFDRQKAVGVVKLNNNILLSKKLRFSMSFKYQGPSIQGTYDLSESCYLNSTIRYSFMKNKAHLSIFCNDIFNYGMPKAVCDYKEQDFQFITGMHGRSVGFNFTYNFGNYKKKRQKNLDTRRFGH